MDYSIIEKTIDSAAKITRNLQQSGNNYAQQRELLEKLLATAEKGIVKLRNLISMMPEIEFSDYKKSFIHTPENYKIKIRPKNNSGRKRHIILLPFLLPNRRKTSIMDFKRTMVASLRTALSQYCKSNNVKPFQDATVVFHSYYAKSDVRKQLHDNDNTEISAVLNALTGYLIDDDNGLCCQLCILSTETTEQKSFTKITVLEGK